MLSGADVIDSERQIGVGIADPAILAGIPRAVSNQGRSDEMVGTGSCRRMLLDQRSAGLGLYDHQQHIGRHQRFKFVALVIANSSILVFSERVSYATACSSVNRNPDTYSAYPGEKDPSAGAISVFKISSSLDIQHILPQASLSIADIFCYNVEFRLFPTGGTTDKAAQSG